MFPDARRTIFAHFLEFTADGDQAEFVAVGEVEVCQIPSVACRRSLQLRNFIVVGQRQKAADVGIDQPFTHDFGHFAFRAQDFSHPQARQDALLVGVVRPHNHARQSQVEQIERRQDGGFKILTNGDHCGVEVLHVLGHQGFFVCAVQRHRQADVFLEQFSPLCLGIEGEHFGPATGERQCDLGAVSASAKHSES